MRIFIWKCKTFLRAIIALALSATVLLFLYAFRFTAFFKEEGTRRYYLYANSSQAVLKSKLSFEEIFVIQGESLALSEPVKTQEEAQKLLDRYEASVALKEEIDGILSYYAYTQKRAGYVIIDGKKVNLHLAVEVDTGRAVIGYPIIFGGY